MRGHVSNPHVAVSVNADSMRHVESESKSKTKSQVVMSQFGSIAVSLDAYWFAPQL
jgi:hypothetical protein